MSVVVALICAYLLGSIPSGYLAGRARGVDIRTVGSRNVGATNVFRTLGRGMGIAVMVADTLKGLAAVLLAQWLTGEPWPVLAAGLAMVGHVFPVWLRFRGGKGVAVGLGTLIGLLPVVSAILFAVWLAIVLATRYVSAASVTAAAVAAPAAWILGASASRIIFAVLAGVVVVVLHRANLRRLARGEELRISLGRG